MSVIVIGEDAGLLVIVSYLCTFSNVYYPKTLFFFEYQQLPIRALERKKDENFPFLYVI